MNTGVFGRTSRRVRIAALAGIVVAIAACGSSAQLLSSVGDSIGSGQAAAPAAAPSAAAEKAPAGGAFSGDTSNGAGSGTAALFREDAKIVRTGSMSLQVADLTTALTKARDAIRNVGGYISASTQSSDGGTPTATVTYRVPVDRWDDALTALRGVALKVLAEKTDAVEVTGQMVDLAARIKNLQASEEALQAILLKATRIPDILEVQQQLTDVRGQIEQLQAQQALLQDQTSYGTITATMGPEVVAVTQAAEQWDPATEVDHAAAALMSVLQDLATAGIWFGIVWLPILLVLGAIILIVAFVLRRAGIRIRRRPEEPPTLPAPEPAA